MLEIVHEIIYESQQNNITRMAERLGLYLEKGEDFTWNQLGIHARDIPCIPHYIYNYSTWGLNHSQGCIQSLDQNCGFGAQKYGCLFYQVTWTNILLVLAATMLAITLIAAILTLFSAVAIVTRSLIYAIASSFHGMATTSSSTAITGVSVRMATLVLYLIFYFIILGHEPNNNPHKKYIQLHHLFNYSSWTRRKFGVLLAVITTIGGLWLLLSQVERLTIQQISKQIVYDNILCVLIATLV